MTHKYSYGVSVSQKRVRLRDFYFSNPLLQIRIRLYFGSTPFKDIFGQKQDIIYTRHLNRTSIHVVDF